MKCVGLINLHRKYFVHDAKHRLGNINVVCLQEVNVSRFLLNSAYHAIWPDGVEFAS